MNTPDKIWLKIKGILSQRSRLTLSLLSAGFLIVVGYFCDNLSLFTGENLTLYSSLQFIKSKIGGDNPSSFLLNFEEDTLLYKDSVLFINIGYEKQLIDYYENDTILKGQLCITDREKLYLLLKQLHQAGSYRYILLDVNFEKGYVTDIDSALFALITDMSGKIVVAKHRNMELASPSLEQNSAFADYHSTIITTNFLRYPYIQYNEASLPLRAYNDLRNKEILPWGMGAYSGRSLCYKSIFLTFDSNPFEEFDEKTGQKNYYNLGTDVLSSPEDLVDLARGKIVVIGDMVNREDMHDTYVGARPGSLVLYRALEDLLIDKHMINWSRIVCLFLLYFVMSFHLFKNHLNEKTPVLYRRIPVLYFFFTFIGYTTILVLFDSVWFLLTNEVYGLVFQSLYFPIIKNILYFYKDHE